MTILLSSFNRGDIAFGRVEAFGSHHLAPFRLKRRDYLFEQRPPAKSPWQNAMLGLPCVELFIEPPCLCTISDRDGHRIARSSDRQSSFRGTEVLRG